MRHNKDDFPCLPESITNSVKADSLSSYSEMILPDSNSNLKVLILKDRVKFVCNYMYVMFCYLATSFVSATNFAQEEGKNSTLYKNFHLKFFTTYPSFPSWPNPETKLQLCTTDPLAHTIYQHIIIISLFQFHSQTHHSLNFIDNQMIFWETSSIPGVSERASIQRATGNS